MKFANFYLIYLFALLPLILFIWGITSFLKKQNLKKLVQKNLWSRVIPDLSYARKSFKAALILLALAFLVLAMMQPQYGKYWQTVTRSGQNIIIALDLSQSMLTEDVRPSRWQKARQETQMLSANLEGENIGLIAFAGQAFIQSPLTLDVGAVQMLLADLEVNQLPTPGTSLGQAIKKARASFKAAPDGEKILILITDGENFNDNSALNEAKKAAREKIKIYTVGVGTKEGAPIPVRDEKGKLLNHKKDRKGQVVISKLKIKLLKKLAQATKGNFYLATNNTWVSEQIYRDILVLEKQKLAQKKYLNYKEQYQWFLIIVFLLLLLEFVILDGKKSKKQDQEYND